MRKKKWPIIIMLSFKCPYLYNTVYMLLTFEKYNNSVLKAFCMIALITITEMIIIIIIK